MVDSSANYNHIIRLSFFFLFIKDCLNLSRRVLEALWTYQLSVLVAFFMLLLRFMLLLLDDRPELFFLFFNKSEAFNLVEDSTLKIALTYPSHNSSDSL